MAFDIIPLEPIERGQLHVMRLDAAIWSVLWVAIAALVELALYKGAEYDFGLPWGVAPGAMLAWGLWRFFSAGRRWRRWGYAFTGRELHVAHGWLTRWHTIVPVARVQHIDIAQGLFQRWFGVVSLALHTAGTENSMVALVGITRETAESIRDAIREQIGSETE
jgi:membrane protein YdbS with pleckstrin-like domain